MLECEKCGSGVSDDSLAGCCAAKKEKKASNMEVLRQDDVSGRSGRFLQQTIIMCLSVTERGNQSVSESIYV